MGRRSDHTREQLRDMAIDSAAALIDEGGLQVVTARKVAAAMGYTVGTLYLVFRNLDDLVLHVNARTLDSLYEDLRAIDEDLVPRAFLRALAGRYVRFAVQHTRRWSAVFDHRPGGEEVLPAWYQARVDGLFALPERSLALLAPARRQDTPQLAARALWAGVHGIVVLSLDGKLALGPGRGSDPDLLGGLVESLVSNYLVGYTGERSP